MKTRKEIEEIKNKCKNISPSSKSQIHDLVLKKVPSLVKYSLSNHQYDKEDFALISNIEEMADFCCLNGLLPLEGNLKGFGISEPSEIKLFMMLIYGSTTEEVEKVFDPAKKREIIIFHGISIMQKAIIGSYIKIYFRVEIPKFDKYEMPVTQDEIYQLLGL